MTAEGRTGPSWLPALTVVFACEALALAIWLVPASIHIASWPASGPVRVALTAPAWQLGALLTIASGVAAAGVVKGTPRWVSAVTPLGLLWLWAVPYLPWIPDRLPLLLLLAGPLRWVVLAVALVLVLRATTTLRVDVDRLNRRAVFAISLAAYLGLGLFSASRVGAGGDEPHYLIIAESLLRDGDLMIENNHQQRDYRAFFGGELRPDFFERGKNGQIYSIHAPGLPALVLPAYAAGGRVGAVVFIACLAALAALAIFDLSEAVAGRSAAVVAWAASCFTVPFIPHAWMIFPEIPGALVVAWAALWVWRPGERSAMTWAWRGAAIGALPWLHTKFVVFLAVFGGALALKLVRRPGRLVALVAPIAISAALWLYSFYAIYGVFDYEAPYGAYIATYVLTKYIPHGLVGILFDQKFGLLFYSPVYLCAVAGAWLMVRRSDSRYLGVVLLAAIGAFAGSTARLYMFWGGSSAPARFLVPIVPCLAPMVALAIKEVRGTLFRSLAGVWLAVSLGVAVVGVVSPERFVLFSNPHGQARLLEMIQGASPLALVVPTFTEPDWASRIPALGAWLAAGGLALLVAGLVARRGRTGAWGVAGIVCITFLAAGAVVSAKPGALVRDETAQRGALDLLWRFDGRRFRTFDYGTGGRASAVRLQELTTIVLPLPSAPLTAGGYVSGPLTLPAGAYRASVWFTDNRPGDAEVLVTAAPGIVLGRASGELASPAVVSFDLAVALRRLTLRVPDARGAAAITRIEIQPVSVAPPDEREQASIRLLEPIPGREAAYLAYTDEHAYPEGGIFWSRGTDRTLVLVAPAGASRMTLMLSTGPMSGTVHLSVAGRPVAVDMVGGKENAVSFDLPQGVRAVPLTVESTVMFRPAEIDRVSTDRRGLGCQVRISLE